MLVDDYNFNCCSLFGEKNPQGNNIKKTQIKTFSDFFVIYKSTCTIFISPANL